MRNHNAALQNKQVAELPLARLVQSNDASLRLDRLHYKYVQCRRVTNPPASTDALSEAFIRGRVMTWMNTRFSQSERFITTTLRLW
jgi:hypothetical protein